MGDDNRPALPEPALSRWQPLRLGLVELYRYDAEEFWFRDGHLLLRGNNGTGKSKVLSLTLPLLLDAQLRPARLEPDGDPGKKMSWNLLLGDAYARRTGYSWIEFGRRADDGTLQYLTLGVGLHAVAARPQVEAWYFLIEQGRLGRDLWLTNPQRVVLTRERLREALAERGVVFDSAETYRRAVDERLYQLGSQRYAALMDTLIQLRQPQLSRRPDERGLSLALTEALPPLAQDLLADVAEAMTRLEDERRQLEETQRLHSAVQNFDQRYRLYAGLASRRQARVLRQAQTEHDNSSRLRHESLAELQALRAQEAAATQRQQRAERALEGRRQQLDTLLADPLNNAALRLDEAARDARRREQQAEQAARDGQAAAADAEREAVRLHEQQARSAASQLDWQQCRAASTRLAEQTGVGRAWQSHPWAQDSAEALSALAPALFEQQRLTLQTLPAQRREHLQLLRRRLAACSEAARELQALQQRLAERQADAEEAAERRAAADEQVEAEGRAHQLAWAEHLQGLRELQLDAEVVLNTVGDWVLQPRGEHPAREALRVAQTAAALRLAEQRLRLTTETSALQAEHALLEQERLRLQQGQDSEPTPPPWRAAGTRDGLPGAPLWQLIDFHDAVPAPERAALEAALAAAGLLDAWLTADGRLLDGDAPWRDAQLLARTQRPAANLGQVLRAALPTGSSVAAAQVQAVLAGIAYGEQDPGDSEAWLASDGRFRLAGLAGSAAQPAARHIGHAARQAARERRLAEIGARLAEIAAGLQALAGQDRALNDRALRIEAEWRLAPSEQNLRQAHENATACTRELAARITRVAEAEQRHRAGMAANNAARQALETDAADLHLPVDPVALDSIERALQELADTLHRLAAALRVLGAALPELSRQQQREAEARQRLAQREAQLGEALQEQEAARSRLAALNAALGDDVQALRLRVAHARQLVQRVEAACKTYRAALGDVAQARARAEQRAQSAEQQFINSVTARSQAVEQLRAFAATGLLSAALPEQDLPDVREAWTIDPALTLARRVEQVLATLDDGDERWKRVQQQVTEDLAELQRSLGALGHQAAATTTDFGFVVHIQYRNRPEPPARLAEILAGDLAARSALLTAREREVLENHLQAEIASEIQRLMRQAQAQVEAINRELQQRPTSTGVRFRLQWQALPEGAGAPVGLHAARERLLQTSAELWTADDRRALGRLLQQRIQDERQRPGGDSEGSLLEQLARALDHRHWHQFRVERLQDGQWRKLSGPASSGERALGLTVPLFAAVASFYGSSPLAPRLMLLDEAFAGIDDAARAHCMGLVREFDLDFVITSEREWGCYAELPGVAICQLQRREGIDAVFVSRWAWDGKARRLESDPGRRFPQPA